MALDEDVSVFIADSHATCAAVALVVGIERTGEASGGGAGVRVGELEGLHGSGVEWKVSKSFYDTKGENSFMLLSGGAAAAVVRAAAFGGGFAPKTAGTFFGGTIFTNPTTANNVL